MKTTIPPTAPQVRNPGTDPDFWLPDGTTVGLLSRISCRPGANQQDLPADLASKTFADFMRTPSARYWLRGFTDQGDPDWHLRVASHDDVATGLAGVRPGHEASPAEAWLAMRRRAFTLLARGIETFISQSDVQESLDLDFGHREVAGSWCRADGIIFAFFEGRVDAYFAESPTEGIDEEVRTDNDRCMAHLLLADLALQVIAERGAYAPLAA